MDCRIGCGACCIAPSISSAIPGMPHGKPGGVRCIQLTDQNLCRIFGSSERPPICGRFSADAAMCGETNEYALSWLSALEASTLAV